MEEQGFDHVGILVRDFADISALCEAMGWPLEIVDRVPEGSRMEAAIVTVGGVNLEFLRPTGPGGRVSAELAGGRGGVHHIAITVPDAAAALAELGTAGAELRDAVPRAGIEGTKIGFAEIGGALLEVVEHQAR